MRAETKLLFSGSPHKRKREQVNGLRTRKQIELFREREGARRAQAERREAEARVRQMNVDTFIRVGLFVLGLGIGISVIIGGLGNPVLLRLSIPAATAWGLAAASLTRVLRPRFKG